MVAVVSKTEPERRKNGDRRCNPDRRTGLDRRCSTIRQKVSEDIIFNTKEACQYLKISRPTFLKYLASGQIKAQKIGNGWRVFKTELDRFVRGD